MAIPYFFLKILLREKYRTGLAERLGFISSEKLKKVSQKSIWFHAVSVGEASAAFPLYEAFKKKYPDISVVFSTTTKTGREWILPRLFEGDISIYFPMDLYWSVRRTLSQIHPMAVIIIETEIWPNFWWEAKKQHAMLALVNGRLSEKSFRRYRNVSFFMRELLKLLSFVSVQSEQDRIRFLELGVPAERIVIGGSLKFEASLPRDELFVSKNILERELKLNAEIILIGGSTHEGEEKVLIDCYQKLKKEFSLLRLILAPRRPERFNEVEWLIEKNGFHCLRESKKGDRAFDSDAVLLIDSIGKLPLYYSLATIAFIGKSLTAHGGQNFLEPAALGKTILFGPHMENFQTIADMFLEDHAMIQVRDEGELEVEIKRLLNSEKMRTEIGERAKKLVDKKKGALALNLLQIERYLGWKN